MPHLSVWVPAAPPTSADAAAPFLWVDDVFRREYMLLLLMLCFVPIDCCPFLGMGSVIFRSALFIDDLLITVIVYCLIIE